MSAVRGLHQQRVNPQPAETQRHRSTALPGDLRDRFARARHSVSSPSSSLNGFRVERAAAEERENTSLRKRGPSALSRRHHTALPTDVQRAPLTCCAADADESAGTNRRDSRDPETDVATRDRDGRSSNLILGWPHSLIHSRRHCFAHRTQRAPSHSATSPTRRRRSVSSCPPHQFLTAEPPDRAANPTFSRYRPIAVGRQLLAFVSQKDLRRSQPQGENFGQNIGRIVVTMRSCDLLQSEKSRKSRKFKSKRKNKLIKGTFNNFYDTPHNSSL